MDKEIGAQLSTVNSGADLNFVSTSFDVVASASVPRTVTSIFVNGELMSQTNPAVYYAMLLVTGQDGTIPTLPSTDMTALNSWVDTNKGLIWCTQMGFVWAKALGQNVAGSNIVMEPGTSRTLMPGQKIVLALLARNHTDSVAQAVNYLVDWNVWFKY